MELVGLKLTYMMLTSPAALLHTICVCINICGVIKVHNYAIEVLPVLMSDEYKCRCMCLFIAIIINSICYFVLIIGNNQRSNVFLCNSSHRFCNLHF